MQGSECLTTFEKKQYCQKDRGVITNIGNFKEHQTSELEKEQSVPRVSYCTRGRQRHWLTLDLVTSTMLF